MIFFNTNVILHIVRMDDGKNIAGEKQVEKILISKYVCLKENNTVLSEQVTVTF